MDRVLEHKSTKGEEEMGPPPAPAREPRSLSSAFDGSADSGYTGSGDVVGATSPSAGKGSGQIKQERGADTSKAESKAEVAEDITMGQDGDGQGDSRGDSSTEGQSSEDDDDADEPNKRARVDLGGSEAQQEQQEAREELEFHAREWRLAHPPTLCTQSQPTHRKHY